jgi:hypothetical protein
MNTMTTRDDADAGAMGFRSHDELVDWQARQAPQPATDHIAQAYDQLAQQQEPQDAKDAARWKAEYEQACHLVSKMHFAATGSTAGPKRGVVEDVEDALKDAARYRWLRENGEPNEGMNYRPDWSTELYDAAIDAAMESKK